MPKPEWGVKRLCGACATRFYDLGKEEAECPSCGTAYVSALAMAERAKASKATAADDEDVVDDEDDVILKADDADASGDSDDADDDDDDGDSDDVTLETDDDDDDDIGDDVLLNDDEDDDDLGDFASVPVEPKET